VFKDIKTDRGGGAEIYLYGSMMRTKFRFRIIGRNMRCEASARKSTKGRGEIDMDGAQSRYVDVGKRGLVSSNEVKRESKKKVPDPTR
jgi:hypothetical protein